MTTVFLNALGNFSSKQYVKATQVCQLMQATLNSAAFQQAVLDASFLDIRLERATNTIDTTLTNQQILDIVLTGQEQGTAADGQLLLKIDLYRDPLGGSTIGATTSGLIRTRKAFFKQESEAVVAGHWLHEWAHTAGFRHDAARTERRPHSVPYLLGDLLCEHARIVNNSHNS